MIFNNDKALTTAKHYQVRFWIYHFLVFFNQYTVYQCKYVIELHVGMAQVTQHQPLPGVCSNCKHLPYTTENLQSHLTCHLTQSTGKPRTFWNFCQLLHSGTLHPRSSGATLFTGRRWFGNRELAEISCWNCVLQRTTFFLESTLLEC